MAPKRRAADSGSASDADVAPYSTTNPPISPSPSKTPPPSTHPDSDLGSDNSHHPSNPTKPSPSPRKPSSPKISESDNPDTNPDPEADDDFPSDAEAKRPRTATTSGPSEQKRPQRRWSPDDELAILRGLTAFRAEHGSLPGSMHDIATLWSSIRGALSVKVATTQLSDKVRRLKQKYRLLATRAKDGKEPEFLVPHDKSVYDLANKVWGTRSNGGGESEEEEESGVSDEDMESGRDERDRKGVAA